MKRGPHTKRHPLIYYSRILRNEITSPHTNRPYPSHTNTCAFCGRDFDVYHIPQTAWSIITCCSATCLWMHRYNKMYVEDKDALFDLADVARSRPHQPSLTLRRRDVLTWIAQQFRQQLYMC